MDKKTIEKKTYGFFESKTGVIIISIIWGLGLSTLFRKSCNYADNCNIIEYRGAPSKLNNKIWNYGDEKKCYKVSTKVVDCSKNNIKK